MPSIYSQVFYNFALAFTSCLCSLKFKGEFRTISGLSRSCIKVFLCLLHSWAPELSKPSVSLNQQLQPLHRGLFFSFDFKAFWLACFLPHLLKLLSTASGSPPWCSTIVFDCFWQTPPQGKACFTWQLCQIKTALWVASSREPPWKSNNNSPG